MSYPQFEDLQVWQKAKELSAQVHSQLAKCEESNIKDQLQRSSIYLMNNIAKGMERKGSKEFDKFLYIARGYCGELKSTLYLAEDLKCINSKQREELQEQVVTVAKMLSGLIKSLYRKQDKEETSEEDAA